MMTDACSTADKQSGHRVRVVRGIDRNVVPHLKSSCALCVDRSVQVNPIRYTVHVFSISLHVLHVRMYAVHVSLHVRCTMYDVR